MITEEVRNFSAAAAALEQQHGASVREAHHRVPTYGQTRGEVLLEMLHRRFGEEIDCRAARKYAEVA